MENLPLSSGFMQNVGDPKGCLHRLAVLSSPGEMLDATGDSELAVSDNIELDEFALYILGIVEKIVEVAADSLGAGVFEWRNEVVEDDVVFIEAAERGCLVRAGCRDAFVLEIGDLLFGAARREGIEAHGPGQCCNRDCSEQKSDFSHFSLPYPQLRFSICVCCSLQIGGS